MNKLSKLRKDIDARDRELISILSARFSTVKKIAAHKKKNNLRSLDAGRWSEVMKKVLSLSKKKGLSKKLATSIMGSIHEESLQIEKQIILVKDKNEK